MKFIMRGYSFQGIFKRNLGTAQQPKKVVTVETTDINIHLLSDVAPPQPDSLSVHLHLNRLTPQKTDPVHTF